MRIKERAYSLLLLMILVISIGGVYTHSIAQCSTNHCHSRNIEGNHGDHHHCSHGKGDCVGHTTSIEHRCASDQIASTPEYIISKSGSGVERVSFAMTLFDGVDSLSNESTNISSIEIDRWRQYDLYTGYCPTLGLLRAPPALV